MCVVFSSRTQQSDDLVEKAVAEHGGPAQNATECINKYKQNRNYRQPQRQKPDRHRERNQTETGTLLGRQRSQKGLTSTKELS